MSDLRLQNLLHTKCVVSCFYGSIINVRSLLADEAHAVCSKLFLPVAHLCQIFAYRTRHTKCVVSCFFGSLSYVRSSLTEQGTRRVQWGLSSGRLLISDLRLQNKEHEVCIELFLRVAQLCQIFAYRTRHTLCVVSYVFGSLTYRHLCHIFAV